MASLSAGNPDVIRKFGASLRAPVGLCFCADTTPPDPIPAPDPDPVVDALDLQAQAASRVIIQYRESPKLLAFIALLTGVLQEAENALTTIPTFDDIDIATGVNLDVIGEIVGISRRLGNGTDVTDALYRTLIRAQILRNQGGATNPELLAAIALVLGTSGILYTDWGGMAVGYQIPRAPTADEVAILDSSILPRPMGVEITRSWFDPTNYFGFAANPAAFGFDVGKLATSF